MRSSNPRFHLHFTPTYSSWLNQVERWFALITERAIRRNSFTSVRELKQQIELFVQRYNADATPFQWVATPFCTNASTASYTSAISLPEPLSNGVGTDSRSDGVMPVIRHA